MSNKKATEARLNALHGAVAEVLTAQVLHQEAETTFDAEGNMVETGDMVYVASPATIAAAIKFLKDNSITCDIEVDKGMNSLKDALAAKQKHSRLASVTSIVSGSDVH
jgi:hypothetical protein